MEDYESIYGVTSHHDNTAVKLRFVTNATTNSKRAGYKKKDTRFLNGDDPEIPSKNVGSRMYMLAGFGGGGTYNMWKLKNRQFSFDVDVSNLPCGLNGALYFVEMAEDGGSSKYDSNSAGANYGTGYCDAQCPHDLKFIHGEANTIDWVPSTSDPNSGTGHYGSCCTEVDIWEANFMSTAYTPHTCDKVSLVILSYEEKMHASYFHICGGHNDGRILPMVQHVAKVRNVETSWIMTRRVATMAGAIKTAATSTRIGKLIADTCPANQWPSSSSIPSIVAYYLSGIGWVRKNFMGMVQIMTLTRADHSQL